MIWDSLIIHSLIHYIFIGPHPSALGLAICRALRALGNAVSMAWCQQKPDCSGLWRGIRWKPSLTHAKSFHQIWMLHYTLFLLKYSCLQCYVNFCYTTKWFSYIYFFNMNSFLMLFQHLLNDFFLIWLIGMTEHINMFSFIYSRNI